MGRKSAIKGGVLDGRFGPELQRQPTARPSAGERRADLWLPIIAEGKHSYDLEYQLPTEAP